MIDIYFILDKYKPDDDIFSEETDLIKALKDIIYNKLTEVERRVLLIYAEKMSLRKTAMELNVSASSIHQKIIQIRKKIYDHLKSYNIE